MGVPEHILMTLPEEGTESPSLFWPRSSYRDLAGSPTLRGRGKGWSPGPQALSVERPIQGLLPVPLLIPTALVPSSCHVLRTCWLFQELIPPCLEALDYAQR